MMRSDRVDYYWVSLYLAANSHRSQREILQSHGGQVLSQYHGATRHVLHWISSPSSAAKIPANFNLDRMLQDVFVHN